jgi:hypothetical protein
MPQALRRNESRSVSSAASEFFVLPYIKPFENPYSPSFLSFLLSQWVRYNTVHHDLATKDIMFSLYSSVRNQVKIWSTVL